MRLFLNSSRLALVFTGAIAVGISASLMACENHSSEGILENYPETACTKDNEGSFESVRVGDNPKYSKDSYFECASEKWVPVSETIAQCEGRGIAVGDTCNYPYVSTMSGNCTMYSYANRGNRVWEEVATRNCYTLDNETGTEEKYSSDAYAYWHTSSESNVRSSSSEVSLPSHDCTEENEGEKINYVGNYFICKSGDWQTISQVEYECPTENVQEGDTCSIILKMSDWKTGQFTQQTLLYYTESEGWVNEARYKELTEESSKKEE